MNISVVANCLTEPFLTVKFGITKISIPQRCLNKDWKDVRKIEIKFNQLLSDEFVKTYIERSLRQYIKNQDSYDGCLSYDEPSFAEQDVIPAIKLALALQSVDVLKSIAIECINEGYLYAFKFILKSDLFWTDFFDYVTVYEDLVLRVFNHPTDEYEKMLMERVERRGGSHYMKDFIFRSIAENELTPKVPHVLQEFKKHQQKDFLTKVVEM